MGKTLLQGIFLGGGLIIASGIAYKLYQNSNSQKQNKIYDHIQAKTQNNQDGQIQQIIQEIFENQKEIIDDLEITAEKIDEQNQGRLSQQQIKEMLLNAPITKSRLQKSQQTILDKHNLQQEQFDSLVQNNNEIQEQIKNQQQKIEQAASGDLVPLNQQLPEFLTEKKVLQIQKQILQESSILLKKSFNELFMEAAQNQQPPDFRKIEQMADKIQELKEQILQNNGLSKEYDPLKRIFKHAINKHKEINSNNFNDKYGQLAQKHSEITNQITMNPMVDIDIAKIFQEIEI